MSKWKFVGICIVVIVVLLIVMVLTLVSSLNRRLPAEIAKIRASGGPVSAADMMAEKVPDPINGAVVYQQITQEMEKPAAEKDFDTLGDFSSPSSRTTAPGLWDQARQAVRRQSHILPKIGEAVSRPHCRFDADWSRGAAMLFPHFSKMRRMALLCRANALLAARDGRMEEAVRSIDLAIQIAESLKEEPTMIGLLVRSAALSIASRSLQDCLQYGSLSEGQSKVLYDTLSKIDLNEGYLRGMAGERVIFMIEASRLRSSGCLPSMPPAAGGMGSGPGLPGAVYARLFSSADEAAYLRYIRDQIESVDLTYREAKAGGYLDDDPSMPLYAVLAKMMGPMQSRLNQSRYVKLCQVAGDQVFLALLAYKARYGVYPSSITELKAKLGWTIPKDTFSDKDFRYKRLPKGFLLYSVGPNMKDDGGIQHVSSLAVNETGDYVWGMER